jgi:hypothetical protein
VPKFAAKVYFNALDVEDAESKLEFLNCDTEDLEVVEEDPEDETEEVE